MPTQDASELVVASHGDVYIAPVGTTLPTAVDGALDGDFIQVGFITEDGVTLSVTPTIDEFMAWQSRQAVRRELSAQEIQIAFSLEQWNEHSIVLAFGGGTVTEPSPGEYQYDFIDEDAPLDERSIVLDWQDGDKQYRSVFERGNVTESVETNFVRSALAVLPITFKVLSPTNGGSPGYILTDDPSFEAGS